MHVVRKVLQLVEKQSEMPLALVFLGKGDTSHGDCPHPPPCKVVQDRARPEVGVDESRDVEVAPLGGEDVPPKLAFLVVVDQHVNATDEVGYRICHRLHLQLDGGVNLVATQIERAVRHDRFAAFKLMTPAVGIFGPSREIGRASCRERVL